MQRLHPITIGAGCLMVAVAGASAYVLWRPRPSQRGSSAAAVEPAAMEPAAAPAERLVPARAPARSLPPTHPAGAEPGPVAAFHGPEMVEPNPPIVDAAVAKLDGAMGPPSFPSPFDRRRLYVLANRGKVLSQVDEAAFETLKLPESARIAIRRINEEHALKAQDLLAGREGSGAVLNAAEEERRSKVDTLLGPELAKEFQAAEFSETRRAWRQSQQRAAAPKTVDPTAAAAAPPPAPPSPGEPAQPPPPNPPTGPVVDPLAPGPSTGAAPPVGAPPVPAAPAPEGMDAAANAGGRSPILAFSSRR